MQERRGLTFTVDYNEIYIEGFIAAQDKGAIPKDCPYVTIPMIRAWIDGFEAARSLQSFHKAHEVKRDG